MNRRTFLVIRLTSVAFSLITLLIIVNISAQADATEQNQTLFLPITFGPSTVASELDDVSVYASATNKFLKPDKMKTRRGSIGSGQSVNNLHTRDLSGSVDGWSQYVEFMGKYQGHRSYYLPTNISPAAIKTMRVRINYRGPEKSIQTWTWRIYSWSAKRWVTISNNKDAQPWTDWQVFTFTVPGHPAHYVHPNTREIRVRLQSNNDQDAMNLDYETLILRVGSRPKFYVATDGNDSNPGTFRAPWRTIQHAAENVPPGSEVYIRGGTYREKVTVKVSGAASAYTRFQNYKDENVIVNGSGLSVSGAEGLFVIKNRSYLVIQGLKLRNLTTDDPNSAPAGIWVRGNAHHIELRNNTIQRIKTLSRAEGNALGIAIYGDGTQAMHNIIVHGNEVSHLQLGNSEALVLNGDIHTFQVTNNHVHHTDNIGIDLIGWYGTSDSRNDYVRNGVVRKNHVHHVSSFGNPAYGDVYAAGGIYVDGGRNIVIEQNKVHHADFGIELASENQGRATKNITLRSNFIYYNYISGLAMGGYDADRGSAEENRIFNNTFYKNGTKADFSSELYLQHHVKNNKIFNNIFFAGEQNRFITSVHQSLSNNSMDHNLFYSAGGAEGSHWEWNGQWNGSLTAYRDATGNDQHSQFANPQIRNENTPNLRLKSISPAIDQGLSIRGVGIRDINNQKRTQGGKIDIGADEVR